MTPATQHCSADAPGDKCVVKNGLDNKQRNQIRVLSEVTGVGVPAGLESMGHAAANQWIGRRWADYLSDA